MSLPCHPRPRRKRLKRIPIPPTRRRHLALPSMESPRPVLHHVSQSERVKRDMLPLDNDERPVGEGVHAQAEHGAVGGEVVGDAAWLVAFLPGEGGEVVRVSDDGGEAVGAGGGDEARDGVGGGGLGVNDVGEGERGAGGGEDGGDVPFYRAGGLRGG